MEIDFTVRWETSLEPVQHLMWGLSQWKVSSTFDSFFALCVITTCIQSMMGGYIFSLFVQGGTPSPSYNTSTGPMSFLGRTPVTGPWSFQRGCTPVPGRGCPRPRLGYAWAGQDEVPPSQDGVPLARIVLLYC